MTFDTFNGTVKENSILIIILQKMKIYNDPLLANTVKKLRFGPDLKYITSIKLTLTAVEQYTNTVDQFVLISLLIFSFISYECFQ